MTSQFDSLFSSVGYPVLGLQFGEPAEYLFRCGDTQSFTDAIVDRNPPEAIDEKGVVYQPKYRVELSIDPAQVNTGGDRIRIKEHATDTEFKEYAVYKLNSQVGLVSSIEIV